MDGPLLLLYLALLGLASGLVMSLVGASAVMVIVPGLNLVLGTVMHKAIGVSLLVDVLASLAVGYAYWRHGNVDLRQSLWIALGSIAGAQLGAGYTVVIPSWLLAISYGLWMVGAGATIWSKGLDRTKIADRFYKYVQFESHAKRVTAALVLGFLIGLNSGIFGAGGGVMIMLVLMFVLDYPIHSAIGTSTIIMAITAGSATLGYLVRGNVDVFVSALVSIGTILGGVSGAKFANLASEETLSKAVGGIFVLLGVVMTLLRIF
ncbi:MAG: sulfite exporter TauE/SafE family protein [Candidatus Bathyarchaeota archaeon]|nr:MAG: sulfite exporter TauE/SafE family protein [Candidatus Bathyarchaeota archaeon]